MTLKWYILSLKLVQKFKYLSVVQLRKLATLYPTSLISRLQANVKQHNQVIAFAFEVKLFSMPTPRMSQLLRSGRSRHRCILSDEFGKPESYLQAFGRYFWPRQDPTQSIVLSFLRHMSFDMGLFAWKRLFAWWLSWLKQTFSSPFQDLVLPPCFQFRPSPFKF